LIGGAGLSVIGLGPIAGNIATFVPPELRGRAIGMAFAGTGVGTLVFIPFYTWVMAQFGWRNTFLFQAALSIALIVPLLALGLKNPTHVERTEHEGGNVLAGLGALLRIPLFWVLIVVGLTAMGPLRSLTVHQFAYLEEIGFQRSTAAGYIGLAGLMTFGAYLMWGWFSDRFGRALAFTLGAIALIGAVVLLFVLRQVQLAPLLLLYAVLYGLGEGTRSSQTTALASDIFQSRGPGMVNGVIGGMFGLGAALGPWVVGFLRDETGSYTSGLFVVVGMITVSIVGFIIVAANRQTVKA
ncbi:MAG: MFS transporter, partial [Chloroflexota bacterium]